MIKRIAEECSACYSKPKGKNIEEILRARLTTGEFLQQYGSKHFRKSSVAPKFIEIGIVC